MQTSEITPENAFSYTANDSRITLNQQDCIVGMQQRVERASVDVVVTSPPYNLSVSYGTYDDGVFPL